MALLAAGGPVYLIWKGRATRGAPAAAKKDFP
jgi:hypothetical protein